MSGNAPRRFALYFYPLGVLLGLGLGLVILEGFFQLMPVGDAVLRAEVDPIYRVKRFEPHGVVRWSAGWSFAYRTVKASNNQGFLNDHDCVRTAQAPTMAIVGDSYVEAMQVRNEATHHGLLSTGLRDRGQVCGIGTSGSPLSNYLVYAGLARDELSPRAMAFLIVGNDFDEAMCRYAFLGNGVWCFHGVEDGRFELVPVRRPSSVPRRLGRHSALLRYVTFNLQIDWRDVLGRLAPRGARAEFVGNVPARVDARRLRDSKLAVDLFLELLPEKSALSRDRLLFVVGAMRQEIYAGGTVDDDSFFAQMRQYFMAAARAHGHEVIDLQDVFARDYSAHGEKFEFPVDGHWSALGHYVVAAAMAGSEVFSKTFGGEIRLGERPRGLVY